MDARLSLPVTGKNTGKIGGRPRKQRAEKRQKPEKWPQIDRLISRITGNFKPKYREDNWKNRELPMARVAESATAKAVPRGFSASG